MLAFKVFFTLSPQHQRAAVVAFGAVLGVATLFTRMVSAFDPANRLDRRLDDALKPDPSWGRAEDFGGSEDFDSNNFRYYHGTLGEDAPPPHSAIMR